MSDISATQHTEDAQHFSIDKIYLKDSSLEAPNLTATLMGHYDPSQETSLEYQVETATLSNDVYEVVLSMKLVASNTKGTVLIVETKQAGIFTIRNLTKPERKNRYLNVRCPRILLPYAREAISNLIAKSGLPPVVIGPLDFVTPFKQATAANQDQAATS